MKNAASHRQQGGMFLIEVLIAMLIFMLGILALLGVSSMAVAAQSGAEYRTQAAQLTNEIAQQIWVSVDRSGNAAVLRTSLLQFQHQPDGVDSSCEYSGAESTRPAVVAWKAKAVPTGTAASDLREALPGTTAEMLQIKVDQVDNINQVTINLCWKGPTDLVARRHSLITLVN